MGSRAGPGSRYIAGRGNIFFRKTRHKKMVESNWDSKLYAATEGKVYLHDTAPVQVGDTLVVNVTLKNHGTSDQALIVTGLRPPFSLLDLCESQLEIRRKCTLNLQFEYAPKSKGRHSVTLNFTSKTQPSMPQIQIILRGSTF